MEAEVDTAPAAGANPGSRDLRLPRSWTRRNASGPHSVADKAAFKDANSACEHLLAETALERRGTRQQERDGDAGHQADGCETGTPTPPTHVHTNSRESVHEC